MSNLKHQTLLGTTKGTKSHNKKDNFWDYIEPTIIMLYKYIVSSIPFIKYDYQILTTKMQAYFDGGKQYANQMFVVVYTYIYKTFYP